MMQLATNAIYGLLYVARYSTQIDQNVSHFFSHIHVWSYEAKIFLNFYYFIHWIHMDHGKPGKLCNLRISFSRPGRSWKIMENLTSVWYRYIKSLQMLQHGERISDK